MTTDEMRVELLRTTMRYGKVNMGIHFNLLSQREFMTLQCMKHYQERQSCEKGLNVGMLAAMSDMSLPAMSRILKAVEEKGLVERTVDRENRRKTYVSLTEAGEKAREEAWKLATDYVNRVVEAMGEEKMSTFLTLWKEMVDIMEGEIKKNVETI